MTLKSTRTFVAALISSSCTTSASFWSDANATSLLAAAIKVAYGHSRHLRSELQISVLSTVVGNILSAQRAVNEDERQLLRTPYSTSKRGSLTLQDFAALVEICESIVAPVAEAISRVGTEERKAASAMGKAYVEVLGDSGLLSVARVWEDFAVSSCLYASQRDAVARSFSELRRLLEDDPASNLAC